MELYDCESELTDTHTSASPLQAGWQVENFSRDSLIPDTEAAGIIDANTIAIFRILNFVVLYGLVGVFGVITNILNIAVLVKLGFRTTVNIGLFALALSDLGSLIALLMLSIFFNPLFAYAEGMPFAPYEVQYLTVGIPRVFFVRMASWFTAYVAFERCVCVIMPLKVKFMVTPTRVVTCLVIIAVLVVIGASPVYYTSRLEWLFYPNYNKTLLGLAFTGNREEVDRVIWIMNFLSPWGSIAIVSLCTGILVFTLKNRSRWRAGAKGLQTKDEDGVLSSRDRRVFRMTVMLSTMFLITSLPKTAIYVTMALVPDYSIVGRFQNILNVTFSFAFLLESINSSVNIFIFYKMGTDYRAMFQKIFAKCGGSKKICNK